MAYIGNTPTSGAFKKLDNIQSSFNGVTTTFTLAVGAAPEKAGTAQNLIISLSGVVQEPGVAYTTSGTTITFQEAPLVTDEFFGVILGSVGEVSSVTDGAITAAKLGTDSVTTTKILDGAVTAAKIAGGSVVNSVNGATGAVTGIADLTTTQTLSNKTLADPKITIAGSNGASGQTLLSQGAGLAPVWGSAGTGLGGTTITGDVTLTAASPGAMSVTPASPGLYVTLPDATTVSESTAPFSVYNNGDYDYGVKDSTGRQLGWVRAHSGAFIGLADGSTVGGVWAYYGLEKLGITANYNNPQPTGISVVDIKLVSLDSNRSCLLFGGTALYAIVYDASTKTWGSATLVRASITNGGRYSGILSSANQVLVASALTTSFQAVTLTIQGTSVTVNTPASITLSASIAGFGALALVGTTFCAPYLTTSSNIVAMTVSGSSVTIGTPIAVTGGDGGVPRLFVSGSTLRTVYYDNVSSIECVPYTAAGLTLTAGTGASATTTSTTSFRAFRNGNGNIVCQHINSSHFATIFNLTGTVEVVSSVSLGTSPTSILSNSGFVQVTENKTVFLSLNAGNTANVNILTDTSGAASAGAAISVSGSGTTFSAPVGLFSTGAFARFAYVITSGDSSYGALTIDCSGASPVLAGQQALRFVGSTPNVFGVADLNGTKAAGSFILANSAISIASPTSSARLQSITGNSIIYLAPIQIVSASGAAVTNQESFVLGATNSSTSAGITIQRVEAAE